MKRPKKGRTSLPVTEAGSLELLASGWQGLDAWRRARSSGWKEKRRLDYLAAKEREAAATADATPAEPLAPEASEAPALSSDLHIIVVSGLPRSGTSMLMQMLDTAGIEPFTDRERSPDESNPKGYYEHDAVRTLARDASWVAEADGHVLKVVSPLLPHLPPGPSYDVIVLDRDLDEVLQSQARMLARSGLDAASAERLRPVYARQARIATAWAEQTAGVRTLVLPHRDVLADPQSAASQIATFLDRDLDIRAMASVVDPSLYRERAARSSTPDA